MQQGEKRIAGKWKRAQRCSGQYWGKLYAARRLTLRPVPSRKPRLLLRAGGICAADSQIRGRCDSERSVRDYEIGDETHGIVGAEPVGIPTSARPIPR